MLVCFSHVQFFKTSMDYSLPDSYVLGDSPRNNTGVGCYAFLQEIFLNQKLNLHLLCLPSMGFSRQEYCILPGFSVHGIFQGRILEWVAVPFSRGIFPIQGSNPGLLHCRQILYHLSHQRSP